MSERIERLQKRVKIDLDRHELISAELAQKLEKQSTEIANLKTFSLATDLHLEAYLPLQCATIAYEVGKAMVPKERNEKYKRHFMKNLVKPFEFKILAMCDPSVSHSSRFRKLQYKLPHELKKYAEKERLKWNCILHNVTPENIHL